MYYHPPRTMGLLIGAGLTVWAFLVALMLLNFALGGTVSLFTFGAWTGVIIAGALAALFGYWTYALATLSYAVDRNGLVINWGATRQVIPLEAIERLVPGTSVGVPTVRGVTWLGYHVGSGHIARIGDVLFYSTHQGPDEVLYVMTPERNYAISVPDPAAFAQQIQIRQDLGPTAAVTHHVERSAPSFQGFWHDRIGLGLAGIAVAACALVWLQAVLRYGGLPTTIELAFPPTAVTPIAPVVAREAIFEIPRTATAILGINLVLGVLLHAWDRIAGYVLFIVAAALQAAFFAALAIAIASV